MSSTERRDWFLTATGRVVYVLSPDPAQIALEDIGLSLSRQCRFAGHLRHDIPHYSVAQHSVLVSYACNPENALIGLLHDASEAYVQDIIKPLKNVLGHEYEWIEARWAGAIGESLGLGRMALVQLPEDVKRADVQLLATERRDLIEHGGRTFIATEMVEPLAERIVPWSQQYAFKCFEKRFLNLHPQGGARHHA